MNPVDLVDPELRPMAVQMLQAAQQYRISEEAIRQYRKAPPPPAPEPRADIPVAERRVPGAKGAPDVQLYVVNGKPGGSRPGILHMHGGGFILGSAKASIREMQDIAAALDCVVVGVEYRLAPETRYPGPVEDGYAGLEWMHANAGAIGVDVRRIALLGDSAGGGLAAMVAIAARDRGEIPVLFQALIYPMLDDRTGSARAVPAHIGTIGWTAEFNRFAWGAFLGAGPGGAVPAAAAPARAANLAGLPPAFIGVGALDLFVQEDVDYARRLLEAGVPTELLVVSGAFHGFDVDKSTSVARRFTEAKLTALRRAFANAERTSG
jgi:acetyl esterase/lipase